MFHDVSLPMGLLSYCLQTCMVNIKVRLEMYSKRKEFDLLMLLLCTSRKKELG
jgi:hypothetical protein